MIKKEVLLLNNITYVHVHVMFLCQLHLKCYINMFWVVKYCFRQARTYACTHTRTHTRAYARTQNNTITAVTQDEQKQQHLHVPIHISNAQ